MSFEKIYNVLNKYILNLFILKEEIDVLDVEKMTLSLEEMKYLLSKLINMAINQVKHFLLLHFLALFLVNLNIQLTNYVITLLLILISDIPSISERCIFKRNGRKIETI